MTSALAMRRRAMKVAASGPAVSDTFNRADSATTMGNADTGQAWVPNFGTWGISANQAYHPSASGGSQATTVVEAGLSDGTVKVTMVVTGDAGPCFRSVDDNNNFVWSHSDRSLYKRVAGTFTLLASTTVASASGDVLEVVLVGASINVKRNGASFVSASDAAHQTATKHGLRVLGNADGPNVRFDDFSVAA